jgi:ABC-type branched-subunit amino acid transport system substrate-binding protein
MSIYTIHTAGGYSLQETGDGAQTAINLINAAGGVDGHPLKLIECNEGQDPNLATQCGVQAESDHVSAIVGSQSVYSTNFYPYLKSAKIANIGDVPTTAADNTNPLSFAFGDGIPQEYAALGIQLAHAGCTKVAILSPDIAALQESIANFTAGVKSIDKSTTIEPTINFPIGNPDDSQQAEQVASEGANCAVALTDPPDEQAILLKIHQLAPNVKVGWIGQALDPGQLAGTGAAAEGQYVASQAAPPSPSTATTTKFVSAMKKYYPNDNPDLLAEDAYASVMVFADVAKSQNLTAFNSASVLAALNKSCSVSPPLFATVDFCHAGPVAGAPRLFNMKSYQLTVKGNEYVLRNNAQIDSSSALSHSSGL